MQACSPPPITNRANVQVFSLDPMTHAAILTRCIEEKPGIHLRELGRQTGLGITTASEVLSALERQGSLTSRTDGRYKRYFLPGALDEREEAMVIACRSRRARDVISHLLDHSPASQRDLADATGVTRSAIAPTVRSLVDRGIVVCTRARRQNAYSLADPNYTAAVLARHAEIDPPMATPEPSTLAIARADEGLPKAGSD